MKRRVSILFVLAASVALMSHVLVPHHHHGVEAIVVNSLFAETHQDTDGCPLDSQEESHPEDCIIAEADIFLAKDNGSICEDLQQPAVAEAVSSVESSDPSFSATVSYIRQTVPVLPEAVVLPFGLRAPPVC